jgi:hypothetical protein
MYDGLWEYSDSNKWYRKKHSQFKEFDAITRFTLYIRGHNDRRSIQIQDIEKREWEEKIRKLT